MFVEGRKRNWQILREGLVSTGSMLEFSLPTHAPGLDPVAGFSWDASGCSTDMDCELDRHQIDNRMLFGGNLLRQPTFVRLRQERPEAPRVGGETAGSDAIMNDTLFLGTNPGLTPAMLVRTFDVIRAFCLAAPDQPLTSPAAANP